MLTRDGSQVELKVSPRKGQFCFVLRTVPMIFAVFLFGCASAPTRKVCFNNACLTAEIADNDFKRQQGLMFRKSLSPKHGMLFLFDQESKYSFWMKNMNITLDLIWISKDKQIVDIMTNVKPCSDVCDNLIPKEKVLYVLEANNGFVEKNNIKVGDEARF